MLFAGNIIRHPAFDQMRQTNQGYRQVGDLAVTDQVMNQTFWLGVYPGLKDTQLEWMVSVLQDFCKSSRKI